MNAKIESLMELSRQVKRIQQNVNALNVNDIDHIDIVIDNSHISIKLTENDIDFDKCKQFLISCLSKKIISNKLILDKITENI